MSRSRDPDRPATGWRWRHVTALTAVLAAVAYLVNERVGAFPGWPFVGSLL